MKEYKNVMLISPDTVKGYGTINNNVDDGVLGASIRAVQKVYLTDTIGAPLVERLQELVYNSIKGLHPSIDDDDNAAYKTLLDDYVKDFLAAKISVEITTRISLKIRNIGVSQNSDTNINASQLADIKYLKSTYETYACDYQNSMMKFLKDNQEAFPELNNCECGGKKPDINSRYGNIGLWLGK